MVETEVCLGEKKQTLNSGKISFNKKKSYMFLTPQLRHSRFYDLNVGKAIFQHGTWLFFNIKFFQYFRNLYEIKQTLKCTF